MHDGTKRTHRALLAGAVALVAALAAAPSASAQEDARWLPWLGCWESVDQYADEGMVCLRPDGAGVEILTIAEGEVVTRERLAADGRPSSVENEGCTGSRTARFSEDGRRLFTTSQLTCEGEFERGGQGLMAMTSPASWIDVQVVDGGGREMAWVQHYRPAAEDAVEAAGMAGITAGRGMAVETARRSAATSVDIVDIVEASEEVGNEAAKAWISETGDPFDLDAETLVRLADAGVAPEVIDVMVAISYPERFVVDREEARADRMAEEEYDRYPRRWGGGFGYWGSPFYYDSFYSPYRYGHGYRYGYGFGYRPTVIVVSPTGPGDEGRGRFVRGRGYTRGGSDSGSPGVRDSRGSGSGSSARPSATRRGGSSVGSSSSGSSSSGSSGRTAKRRGGGGGGGGDEGGGF